MSKSYTATFKLWDVTAGEKTGELIDEDGPHTFEGLPSINGLWGKWTAESPVPLDPLNHRTIRVSMTRNNGESVTRRRFAHDGRKYLITIHVSQAPEKYKALINTLSGTLPVEIHVFGGAVTCSLNVEPFVEMERVEE